MKSGKQRRQEILASRRQRAEKAAKENAIVSVSLRPTAQVAVNLSHLAPYNSYGEPAFVQRGWYEDQAFRCVDCGKDELWTAAQQQWWYETIQGHVYSSAIRCRVCRLAKRQRDGRAPKSNEAPGQAGSQKGTAR